MNPKRHFVIGSCRAYEAILANKYLKKTSVFNPLGVVSGLPDILFSFEFIKNKGRDLCFFSKNDVYRFFKQTTGRSKLFKLLLPPKISVNEKINLSEIDVVIIEISSIGYLNVISEKGFHFPSYMPAEGMNYDNLDVQQLDKFEFVKKLDQLSNLFANNNIDIVVMLPHNIQKIGTRHSMNSILKIWAEKNSYSIVDYGQIAKKQFENNLNLIFHPREIENKTYLRHTFKFYQAIGSEINEIVNKLKKNDRFKT